MANKKIDKPQAKKNKTDLSKDKKKSKFDLATIRQFIVEVQAEFGKIAWPSRKQTIGSTVLVTIFVIMVSLYLGGVDLLVGKIVGTVLR